MTNVVTDETLALFQPRQPACHLTLELVQHPLARDARLQRRARDGGLLGPVQTLEQREQPGKVEGEGI